MSDQNRYTVIHSHLIFPGTVLSLVYWCGNNMNKLCTLSKGFYIVPIPGGSFSTLNEVIAHFYILSETPHPAQEWCLHIQVGILQLKLPGNTQRFTYVVTKSIRSASHPELCACGMSPLRLCVRCVWRGDGDRVLGLFQKSIVFHGIYEAGSLMFYSTAICEFLSDSPALYLPSHSRSVGITDISHHGWLLRLALWIQFRSSDFEQWVPCYQSPFFSLFSVPNPITCDFIYWLLW